LLAVWKEQGLPRLGIAPSKSNPSGLTDLDAIEADWIARGMDLRFRR
jgi:hypothetical protein